MPRSRASSSSDIGAAPLLLALTHQRRSPIGFQDFTTIIGHNRYENRQQVMSPKRSIAGFRNSSRISVPHERSRDPDGVSQAMLVCLASHGGRFRMSDSFRDEPYILEVFNISWVNEQFLLPVCPGTGLTRPVLKRAPRLHRIIRPRMV